jgi:hypothetical protein
MPAASRERSGGGQFEPPVEITSRAGLIHALSEAAQLEHGLLLQYLFAAVSLKRRPAEGLTERQVEMIRGWEATILEVARQEMAHLGTVCNLLNAVGAAPEFTRPNFPVANRYYPDAETDGGDERQYLRFALEPFAPATIERFVRFEAPATATDERAIAATEPQLHWQTVGDLYGQIAAAFAALEEDALFIGDQDAQETDDWTARLNIIAIADRASALAAIESIVEEGEGTTSGGEDSHWHRFRRIVAELEAETAESPGFEAARPVLANPLTRRHFESSGGELITDGLTGEVCELHNGVYASMLLMLLQYFSFAGESEAARSALRDTCRRLMSGVIRPLGEVLTELPAGPEHPGRTAGPSFELYGSVRAPVDPSRAWRLFHERLRDQAEVCDMLSRKSGAPPRLGFLATNLRLAAAAIRRAMPGG